MNVKIQSIKFDADKKLIDFVNNKLSKLQRFYDAIIGAEVFLKFENSQEEENKTVEVKLLIPGNDLFVARTAKKFEEALDECLEVLKRQVKKHKEKQRSI
ncbi:MAG: ribosome-associated translation inhibitor RaiA [Bacteroidales bacterium]|jgi:putative sigma-54 modulation protein|nr:ribosome-associated translation inhibitor RaiA [Bacteroidales bacterium]MDD4384042.1 ribosome-associated translation inhibitor RaiA [Bacteroidales bacterium]MDY0197865.1 ribosome-associated translation inhibitor RaiA [Tenuifilaceae bacterium]